MSSPTEEVAKTTRTFLEVMRDHPLALTLALSNIALLGYLYYQGVVASNQRSQEMDLLYKNRTEVGQLLAACVPQQQSELSRQQFEAQRREIDDLKGTVQTRQKQIDALRYSLENRTPLQSEVSREQLNGQRIEIDNLKKEIDELKKQGQGQQQQPP